MQETRDLRHDLEAWLKVQKELPTRKQVRKRFPGIPLQVVRSALAAAEASKGKG